MYTLYSYVAFWKTCFESEVHSTISQYRGVGLTIIPVPLQLHRVIKYNKFTFRRNVNYRSDLKTYLFVKQWTLAPIQYFGIDYFLVYTRAH